MSIMCCVYLPEGIVMAADSRLTVYKTKPIPEAPSAVESVSYPLSDQAQKLVLLRKVPVGISSCGELILGGKMISDYLKRFEEERVVEGDTPETVAKKLFEYLRPHSGRTQFFVCGYHRDEPFVFDVGLNLDRNNVQPDLQTGRSRIRYGVMWNGQQEAIRKLMNPMPGFTPNYFLMPLKDGIDFAAYLIDTTIQYERFKDGISTCGGPVDLLVLTRERAFWHRHKIFNP